LPKIKGALQ
jgi:hypothetical protein